MINDDRNPYVRMSHVLERLNVALQGRYRLEFEIAHGGMGAVFKGVDERHRRNIAMKVLRPELTSAVGAERFLREIEITARLSHPHILPLYDSGTADDLCFYVMPLVEGQSLRQRLASGPLPLDEAVRLTREVADALEHAHGHGFVHRDIKPENILLSGGHALVADFGIARALSDGSRLTETGIAVGTLAYMSPEQRQGKEAGTATDLYALGCMLHEMVVGTPPLGTEPHPGVPRTVEATLRRALASDPTHRFDSARAMANSLDAVAVARSSPQWLATLRRPWAAGLLALGTLAVAFATFKASANASASPADPRRSILVLPFAVTADTPALEWLREGSAHMLRLCLESWREIQVVDRRWLATLARARKVELDESLGLDQAFQLARDAGAGTLVVGDVLGQVDSVAVAINVYDVKSKRPLGESVRAVVAAGIDLRPVFDSMAARLLNLGGAPAGNPRIVAATTNSLPAYQGLLTGLSNLYRWELSPAASAFRSAIAADTTFALAYHYLSMTLAWQDAGWDTTSKMAEAAVRHGAALPWKSRQHVGAHRDFVFSEWRDARERYRLLLAADSMDAEAWLGLGDTEYHDQSLVKNQGGIYMPAANWNVAIAAFNRAVAIDPRFHLGYGHLFDIFEKLATHRGSLSEFAPSDLIPEQRRQVSITTFFNADTTFQAPILSFVQEWRDSLFWVPESQASGDARAMAQRFRPVARTVAARWLASAPREARPYQILRDQAFEDLMREGDARAFGLRAVDRLVAAQSDMLLHSADTARTEVDRLALFLLAAGRVDSAAALAEAGWRLAQRTSSFQDELARKVYVARGQFSNAMRRSGRVWDSRSSNAVLMTGESVTIHAPIANAIDRLEAAVSVGVDRTPVRALWDTIVMMRNDPQNLELAIKTSHSDFVLRHPQVAVPPGMMLSDPYVWRTFISRPGDDTISTVDRAYLRGFSDSALQAGADLNTLLAVMADTAGWFSIRDRFAAATLAQRLGRDADALRLFASIDAAMSRGGLWSGAAHPWAYLSRSYLLRAQSLERLKDTAQAVANYERFLVLWKDADPPFQRFNVEARAGLARLGSLKRAG